MPNTREKLIDLIQTAKSKKQYDFLFGNIDDAIDMKSDEEYIADHLIANGVTVVDKFATTERQWISVKDRLPDETKDEYVLAVCDYHGKIKVETRKMWHIDSVVTHWMPLPEPPKEV